MPSKMVTRQQASTAAIGAAALKNADVLAARLTDLLAAQNLPAQALSIDWKPFLEGIGRFLVDAGNGLVERDNELQKQRRVQLQLRFQRDEAAREIRGQLRGLRFLVDEVFGKEKSKLLFPARAHLQRFEGRALLRVALEAAELLRGAGFTWPDLAGHRHLAAPAEVLASLEQAIPRLAAAVEALDPEKSAAAHALGNKTREFAATVAAMRRSADLLYGFFRYVSYDVEAARLRPRRRKARVSAPEEPPASPNPSGVLFPASA